MQVCGGGVGAYAQGPLMMVVAVHNVLWCRGHGGQQPPSSKSSAAAFGLQITAQQVHELAQRESGEGCLGLSGTVQLHNHPSLVTHGHTLPPLPTTFLQPTAPS